VSGPRFFVTQSDLLAGAAVELPAGVAHHATRVLRLGEGDAITLFNGRGGEFAARLLAGPPVAARIESFDPVERESPFAVTLVQALVAAEKIEWIIEKSTEAGVARIVIAPTARSAVKLAGDRLTSRVTRWNEIALAACCQCGRNRPPTVLFKPTLASALALASDSPERWILAPAATAGMLVQRPPRAATVAIGPEGDWTAEELTAAEQLAYVPAAFGPRVLRTETAGVAAIVALQAVAGDLDLRVA